MRRLLLPALVTLACAPSARDAEPAMQPDHDPGQGGDGHVRGEEHGGEVHEDGYHHDFDDAEVWAKRFEGPERDGWQQPKELMRALSIAPGEKVADLGTGTGYLLPYLVEAVGGTGTVLALDVSDSMIAYVRNRAQDQGWTNVEATLVAANEPGVAGRDLDHIVTVDVWHHISGREAYAALVLEGLAPGGKFSVVDFTAASPVGPPAEHRLRSEEVQAELEAAGFTTVLIEEQLPHQYIVTGTRPTVP